MLDAVVVGSGPNGLAAAIALARAGKSVRVIEGADTIGGGARTAELTEPGVAHDICSAVHPLGIGSPFLSQLPLHEHGLDWAQPPIPVAHPLDDADPVLIRRSIEATAAGLGDDGDRWRQVFDPFVQDWNRTVRMATAPPLRAALKPIAGLGLGRYALRSGEHLANRFESTRARAVIAGLAAHSVAPLGTMGTGGVALLLAVSAHSVGWPFAFGGSGAITAAMGSYLESLGGEVETGRWVRRLGDIPDTRVVLFDTDPRAAAAIAGDRMSGPRRRLYGRRTPGPGIFKVDIATGGPIPWRDPELGDAGTVHLGGTFEQVAEAEAMVADGVHPERPFVLLAQPTVADKARSPQGIGVVWAYCHVPVGSTEDMTSRIVSQIERFAPGFESTIRSISTRDGAGFEEYNPNFVGGDITAGPVDLQGVFRRPTLWRPYRAGPGIYLCSAATPPGAGVHGMCGYWAAQAALKEM